MKSLQTKIKNWKEKLNHPYTIQTAYDLPTSVPKRTVFIIGNKDCAWLISFRCPCGCKNLVQLNLLKEANPFWSYTIKKDKISIRPSIWRIRGCKSHFILKNGRILWVWLFISKREIYFDEQATHVVARNEALYTEDINIHLFKCNDLRKFIN